MKEKFVLSPGVGIYLRDDTTVQCGVDATRMGLIESVDAEALVAALRMCSSPLSHWQIVRLLRSIGFSASAARGLVDELISYGILRHAVIPAQVTVLGNSGLASRVAKMCYVRGIHSQRPKPGENLENFLELHGSPHPIIAVDMVAQTHRLAPLLLELADEKPTFVPVTMYDNRGFVGPVYYRGQGPCPMCTQLDRSDADPCWDRLSREVEYHHNRPRPDPAAVDATLSYLAVIVEKVLQRPLPPGSGSSRVLPGEFWDVDLFGKTQQRVVAPHPNCPVCFAATGHRRW